MTKKKQQTADAHPYAPGNDEPPAHAARGTDGQQGAMGGVEEPVRAAAAGEIPSISKQKREVCNRLTTIFTSKLMNERLLKMAGGDASRVAKNLTAFLAVITQDEGSGDPKKYYYQCSLTSLTTCFLESMNMQLPFDSRKLISMVMYDWEAELDISYKGFVNALSKHYRDAYVDAKLVFQEDVFECEETGGKAVFRHVAKDNFRTVKPDFEGVVGAYCYFSYSLESGEKISRIVRMSRDEIIKVKSKSKMSNKSYGPWFDFPGEMGIKAVIRRGAKIPFAAIDLDVDVEEVANRHYALDKPGSDDRIKLLMAAQEEAVNGEKTQGAVQKENPGGASDKRDDGKNVPGVSDDEKQDQKTAAEKADEKNQGTDATPKPSKPKISGEDKKPEVISDADFEELKP